MFDWLKNNVELVTATVGLITVFAIVLTPIVTLRIEKKIETFKEEKQRRLWVFKTLLATRANIVAPEHVQALNMIDIEFYGERNIRDSWNVYRDHLNSYPQNKEKCAEDYWEEKRKDCLTNLLYEMSVFFGYTFDKVILGKGAYSPVAHGIVLAEQTLIRRGLVEILQRNRSIKVELTDQEIVPSVEEKQN